MISCGEPGAGVPVVCTGPASFDLANVAIDQTAVVATMPATTAKMMILRISCHPFSAWQPEACFGTRSAVPRSKGLPQAHFLSCREPRRATWGQVRACHTRGAGLVRGPTETRPNDG